MYWLCSYNAAQNHPLSKMKAIAQFSQIMKWLKEFLYFHYYSYLISNSN